MIPAAYFAVGRLVYGLIERRDRTFLALEVVGALVFLALAVPILRSPEPLIRGAILGGTFWLIAVAIRFLTVRHPVEAAPIQEPTAGSVVPLGIIDFSWSGIMGGTLAFVTFAEGSAPFADPPLVAGLSQAYYQALSENCRFLLGHTIDGFLALGGVLAACMAILWAGEIWRSARDEDRSAYRRTTIAASKMVLAYFWTSLAVFAWVGMPLYNRLMAANALLR